jgi:hypothetical protein
MVPLKAIVPKVSISTLGSWAPLLPASVPVPFSSIVPAPWNSGLFAVTFPETAMVPLSCER